MKPHNTLMLACCFWIACTNTPSATGTTVADAPETDSINYALNEDSVKLSLRDIKPPEGFYQVMLPCTDCKGIEHTVLFNRDLSYRLEEVVPGTTSAKAATGHWKLAGNDIWLYRDSSVQAHYTWHGDTLHYIDPKTGVRIALRPLPSALTNKTWKDKAAEGVEFFGIGTEPFWNISIDEQKSILFTLAEWPKPLLFKTPKPVAAADSTVYNTRNDSAALRVVVYNTFCSDGMSDNMYTRKVAVRYNETVYEGCCIAYK